MPTNYQLPISVQVIAVDNKEVLTPRYEDIYPSYIQCAVASTYTRSDGTTVPGTEVKYLDPTKIKTTSYFLYETTADLYARIVSVVPADTFIKKFTTLSEINFNSLVSTKVCLINDTCVARRVYNAVDNVTYIYIQAYTSQIQPLILTVTGDHTLAYQAYYDYTH